MMNRSQVEQLLHTREQMDDFMKNSVEFWLEHGILRIHGQYHVPARIPHCFS